MTYLSGREGDKFYKTIFTFFLYLFLFLFLYAINTYLQGNLSINWREILTEIFFQKYLSFKNFLNIQDLENPDQRISEDINSFVEKSITIFFLILDSILQLFAYSLMLYGISKFLFFIAISFSLLINFLGVFLFGKQMTLLNNEKYKLEANLRFSLINIRKNSEAISFSKIENLEELNLINSFKLIIINTKKLIFIKSGLIFFQLGSKNILNIIPMVFLASLYLNKEIDFGVIEQGTTAFVTIMFSLNIISDEIQNISILRTDMKRLIELKNNFQEKEYLNISNIDISKKNIYCIINNLEVKDKNDSILFSNFSLEFDMNMRYLITGKSGIGKTTFLKCIFGLYDGFSGSIHFNKNFSLSILPQKMYLGNRDLYSQIIPSDINISEDEIFEKYFPLVNLEISNNLRDLHQSISWIDILSPGEIQKLSLIKIFLKQKNIFFLDESLSFIDFESREIIYNNLIYYKIIYNSVTHNLDLKKFHTHEINFKDYKVTLTPI